MKMILNINLKVLRTFVNNKHKTKPIYFSKLVESEEYQIFGKSLTSEIKEREI